MNRVSTKEWSAGGSEEYGREYGGDCMMQLRGSTGKTMQQLWPGLGPDLSLPLLSDRS